MQRDTLATQLARAPPRTAPADALQLDGARAKFPDADRLDDILPPLRKNKGLAHRKSTVRRAQRSDRIHRSAAVGDLKEYLHTHTRPACLRRSCGVRKEPFFAAPTSLHLLFLLKYPALLKGE